VAHEMGSDRRATRRAEPRKAALSPKGMFFGAAQGCRYSGYPGYTGHHPSSSVERTGPRTLTDVAETEIETARNRGDRVGVLVVCHWQPTVSGAGLPRRLSGGQPVAYHQSMRRGEAAMIQWFIGCGLGEPERVDGALPSTASATRGTVTGGSRSTGNPRLRGRKTPSG